MGTWNEDTFPLKVYAKQLFGIRFFMDNKLKYDCIAAINFSHLLAKHKFLIYDGS